MTPHPLPELDLFSPEASADLYGTLREVRARSWAATSLRGVEVLTYDACQGVFQDPRFQPAGARLLSFLGEEMATALVGEGRTLLGSEGEDHDVLRQIVSPWFTPRRVGQLRTDTELLVHELLDGLEPDGRGELVGALARVVPGVVFCWMVGAPPEDGVRLATWSESLLKAFTMDPADGPEILGAASELRTYIAELVATKRAEPGDDVATLLVNAADADTIGDADLTSLLLEMLAASTDNTMRSAATMVWLLLTHPDQWALLQADPSLVPQAVEESARFEPSVGSTPVVNLEPTVLHGLELPAETMSWLVLASAHRDPSAYDDPDRFDVTRKPSKGQLSFGIGRHFCLGAALARMELQVVLRAVLERWDDPSLDGEVPIDRSFGTSVRSLPVRFTPRRRPET